MAEVISQEARPSAEVRLPWHRPEIQRLTISLNTQSEVNKYGSGEDGEFQEYVGT
jgi:hypothetical protein